MKRPPAIIRERRKLPHPDRLLAARDWLREGAPAIRVGLHRPEAALAVRTLLDLLAALPSHVSAYSFASAGWHLAMGLGLSVRPRLTHADRVAAVAAVLRSLDDDQLVELAGAALVARLGGGRALAVHPARGLPLPRLRREFAKVGLGPSAPLPGEKPKAGAKKRGAR